jgi:FMN reductase
VSSIVLLSGSPSATSRTAAVLRHLGARLRTAGHQVDFVAIRDLPAAAVLAGDAADPQIDSVVKAIESADGVVVASPVYKAAYSGLLKSLLDLLPQFALRGKTVLPIATGGSPAHVLAIDYAFRPVLNALGSEHVVQGYFVLDQHITINRDRIEIDPASEAPLLSILDAFSDAVHRRTEVIEWTP